MKQLLDTLQALLPLEAEAQAALAQVAKPKQLLAGEVFASPDRVCKHIGFLQSGIARVYHLQTGKEITDYFNTPLRNPLVSSFVSFLTQKVSREYVAALTDCELLLIHQEDLEQLYAQFKSMERLGRLLAERNYLLALERIESLQNQDASSRYEAFLKLYPQLVNQVPNHYIASYLGITPESLSRIRKQLVR